MSNVEIVTLCWIVSNIVLLTLWGAKRDKVRALSAENGRLRGELSALSQTLDNDKVQQDGLLEEVEKLTTQLQESKREGRELADLKIRFKGEQSERLRLHNRLLEAERQQQLHVCASSDYGKKEEECRFLRKRVAEIEADKQHFVKVGQTVGQKFDQLNEEFRQLKLKLELAESASKVGAIQYDKLAKLADERLGALTELQKDYDALRERSALQDVSRKQYDEVVQLASDRMGKIADKGKEYNDLQAKLLKTVKEYNLLAKDNLVLKKRVSEANNGRQRCLDLAQRFRDWSVNSASWNAGYTEEQPKDSLRELESILKEEKARQYA